MTWTLKALTGDFAGQTIKIDRDMLVGRHQDADILLQSAEISRKHAAFLVKEQALWLQDLKSSNGTFVNESRLEQEVCLKDGDVIQFVSLQFSIHQDQTVLEEKLDKPVMIAGMELQRVVTAEKIEIHESPKTEQAKVEIEVQDVVVEKDDTPKTPAQQMNDQGMPELKERDHSVQLTRDGMPQGVAIPKPAPIPEDIDLTAPVVPPKVEKPEEVQLPTTDEQEQQKNASVGLISLIIIIILAIVAFVMFK